MAENPRIEELRRRVQADPASIAFAALAEEFRRVGRHEDAIETCRTGLQRHPAYLSARVTLGRALIETGDYDGARGEFETVLRSAPENLAAIRGLSTIHERLGHAAEMDPHIADMMKTMHAESIRVAVKPPPAPEPVAAAPVALEPIVAAPVEPDQPFDPFKQFLLEPRVETEEELRPEPDREPEQVFQAEPTFQPEPEFQPEPNAPLAPRRLEEPQFPVEAEPPPAEPEPQFEPLSEPEPALDLSLAPPLDGSIVLDSDLALMLESELEPEPEEEADAATSSDPDPEVLATLSRLERFLDSIQSLRA